MASFKPFSPRGSSAALWAAYAATVIAFIVLCAGFYLPGKGFTYLVNFGASDHARFLPELKATNHYEWADSGGYDGQHYAQIAMHPQLGDASIRDAVDGIAYRARRILFSWTAYALAGGDPARALHVYAALNLFCWLGLAVLLLRWFPASDWGNFLRWAGVLFSAGMSYSVGRALVDGPSLLLIAGGVALLEAKRPWLAAAVLGVAGLGKETNVLAGAALAPLGEKPVRFDGAAVLRLALVVLPLGLWLVCLHFWIGEMGGPGVRNFAWPLQFYFGKWKEIAAGYAADPWHAKLSALVTIALTAQFLFIVLRPRWRETWWRVGAAYAALMLVLGEAVWEGHPGAASRVLLPMTLAFNILVPRGRKWWVVLLLGNLSVIQAPQALSLPPPQGFQVEGPRALRIVAGGDRVAEVTFDENWYGPENAGRDFWRWSKGTAALAMQNPQPFALEADVSFAIQANDDRSILVRADGREVWRGDLKSGQVLPVALRGVRLSSGTMPWVFETDRPGRRPANADPRELAFSLRNFRVTLTGRAAGGGD